MGITREVFEKTFRPISRILCQIRDNTATPGGGTTVNVDPFSIQTITKIDDVNGDGSLLVEYVEASSVVTVGGVTRSTPLGTFTDDLLTASYTVNTELILEDAFKQGREVISGATWSPPTGTTSYTIRIGLTSAGVTYTDSVANTTTFEAGEVSTWSGNNKFADTAPVVTVPAGQTATITYTFL